MASRFSKPSMPRPRAVASASRDLSKALSKKGEKPDVNIRAFRFDNKLNTFVANSRIP